MKNREYLIKFKPNAKSLKIPSKGLGRCEKIGGEKFNWTVPSSLDQ
jgi:hypothetical protein